MENEELDEIEYYEVVTLEEISKYDSTFVAFSNDEIYNNLLQFFKPDKIKARNYLTLFTEIINRQVAKSDVNNFIVVADAKRGDFSEYETEDEETQEKIKSAFMINEFVNKIKDSNKIDVKTGFKNKNKIWFPLVYDENSSFTFRPTTTTVIELGVNDYYIVFKDDERDIPIMGVYFYEPVIQDNDNLNDKIASFLITSRKKGELLKASNYKSFDDLISNYKLKLPLEQIDEDDYNYLSLNNLFKKYNKNLDYINKEDFQLLKTHLQSLNKKEKQSIIKYSTVKHTIRHLENNRFAFFSILKKTFSLIDITLKSAKKIQKDLDDIKDQKIVIQDSPIYKDLSLLIANINNDNYSDIIKNLREIRKNLSIDNCTNALENYLKNNMQDINRHFEKLENKFNLLKSNYKDLYEISFEFEKDEHEIKMATDTSNYEGFEVDVKNKVINENSNVDDTDDNLIDDDMDDYDEQEKYKNIELNKYYNKYKNEKGFAEALKYVLPFSLELQKRCRLPINLDVICTHLLNIYGGIPEKYITISEKYNGKYDDSYCKEEAQKTFEYVVTSDDSDDKLIEANVEYLNIIIDMMYDVICKWSIELQQQLLEQTLVYAKDFVYVNCIDLWNEYGAPYKMDAKDGILHYISCIFKDVIKEQYEEIDLNEYIEFEGKYKTKILERINENYKNELNKFKEYDEKNGEVMKVKKGYEAQKKLVKFLQEKKYDNDEFFNTFMESLLYYPSVKFKKIHKYLLGCCLEKIDSDFTNDKFFKTNRTDLEKAKSKYSSDRVLNKKRYLRFYLSKPEKIQKKTNFIGIKYESFEYPIYDIPLEKWFNELDDTTILTKTNVNDIRSKLKETYDFNVNEILNLINKDFFKLINGNKDYFYFKNYRQILIAISVILYKYLNTKAMNIINRINKTILVLDNLNSIINDDNNVRIIQIQTIIIIKAMCLPSFPENKKNTKLESYLNVDIDKKLFIEINKEIVKKINEIFGCKMPNKDEIKKYIDDFREDNKNKVLQKYQNKSIDEKKNIKDLKKFGLNIDKLSDFDENEIFKNKEKTEEEKDADAENEFSMQGEDDDNDHDIEFNNLDYYDFGFIYSKS